MVFQSDTFMQTVQAGMKAAADKVGAEIIMGNTENKLDKEASMIDDDITRKVDAIVITPISADGSIAALKKAKEAGITIICFNTCVNDKTIPSGFLVTKNDDLGDKSGAAAVKFITEKLGGKAKVGMLNCDQFEGCPPRKAGFLAQSQALPGVEVVADQAGWLADKAAGVQGDAAQAHPDINVVGREQGGIVAHAIAVKTLGLAEGVLFGIEIPRWSRCSRPKMTSSRVSPARRPPDGLRCLHDDGQGDERREGQPDQHADHLLRPRQQHADQAVHGH